MTICFSDSSDKMDCPYERRQCSSSSGKILLKTRSKVPSKGTPLTKDNTVPETYLSRTCSVRSSVRSTSERRNHGLGTEQVHSGYCPDTFCSCDRQCIAQHIARIHFRFALRIIGFITIQIGDTRPFPMRKGKSYMCTNILFMKREFVTDYQDTTKHQFLVRGEIADFSVSLHFLIDKTNMLYVTCTLLDENNHCLMSCICAAGCPAQAPRGGVLFFPLLDRAPAAAVR